MNQDPLREALKKYWGYPDFRPQQYPIVYHTYEGKNALAVMPTGGGKSLCYQVPALVKDGLTLVISPLIALMTDQVRDLTERGISAAALHSGIDKNEQTDILNNCIDGQIKLLYASPERLRSRSFLETLTSVNVSMVAVDEAHCISQWGHDFRPAYRRISTLKEIKPDIQILAVTATATAEVRKDILLNLGMPDAMEFVNPSRRNNLSYQVVNCEDKISYVHKYVLAHKEQTGIVYARSRKGVIKLTEFLKKRKCKAGAYHGGMKTEDKNKNLVDWIDDKIKVMVATNAFGMGIDKADVRYVIHIDLPPNLEEYIQEAGRAGRDEKACEAILLFLDEDIQKNQKQIEQKYPPLNFIANVYKRMASWLDVAVGETMQRFAPIDLSSFCEKYELPIVQTYHALTILAKEELILLSNDFEGKSTVQIYSDKFQEVLAETDEELSKFLTMLLRMYDGLFYKRVKVDEPNIAKVCEMDEKKVIKFLRLLHSRNCLEYERSTGDQKLKILGPRLHSRQLNLSEENYKRRKESAQHKLDRIQTYLTDENCRQIFIDGYFDFDQQEACGICDICKSENEESSTSEISTALITKQIQDGNFELEKIIANVVEQGFARKEVLELFVKMESEGLITIVENTVVLNH